MKKNGWFLKPPEQYLNEVAENVKVPVFETPEMPRDVRIALLSRLRRIERQVTRRAVARMIPSPSFLGRWAGYVLATDLFESLFFRNLRLRRWIEGLRYRRLQKQMAGAQH